MFKLNNQLINILVYNINYFKIDLKVIVALKEQYCFIKTNNFV